MKLTKLLPLLLISTQTFGQNDAVYQTTNNFISLEVDPAPFILGGYSFSLKYSPAKAAHFAFMGSVYSSPMPDKMMAKTNRNAGFKNQRIEPSYALFVDYFLRNNREGLHIGPSVFYYNKTVEMDRLNGTVDFSSIYPNIRVGYVIRPFKKAGLYFDPWLNFGKEVQLNGQDQIGSAKYKLNDISYIVALHIGYRFTF